MLNLYLHFFHFLPEPISALAIYDNLDIMESSHLKTTFLKWLASNEKKGSCDRKQHMVCSAWVKNVERTRNNTTRKDWKGWRPIVRWNNDFFLYGSKNEIDGLAALGKYLTVFLPNSLYVKMVVELSNLANDRVMPLRSQNPVFRLNTSLKLATVFTKSIVRHTT